MSELHPTMRDHLATLIDDFRRYGGEIAVVRYHGNRRHATSYGELARMAGRFATLLERRGIGPGDRVVLWGENSAEWMAAFLGCILRGVLAVPLDANGNADFTYRVAKDVSPKLVVGDAVLLAALGATQRGQTQPDKATTELALLNFEDWPAQLPAEEAGPVSGLNRDTPLQILFTSGTTGEPKGIVHTHGNVLASVGPIAEGAKPYMRYERLIHPLRILHTLPLSHVFGQTMGMWVPPIFRAEVHFESRPAAPRLIQIIRRERISVLAAVPRVHALLKTHLEMSIPGLEQRVIASQNVSKVRRWWRFRDVHRAFGFKFWALISGGGALPGPLEQFWNAMAFVLVQGYGMTETTALITLNHPFHVASGTIGKPLAGREVKLGPDGEVLVKGAMISGATWQHGELKPREEEWLATGDIAERQASGELKFMGRKSEVIVTAAGVNVHPEDLEAAIEEQPGVAACAVVGVETAAGMEPCAVIAVRGAAEQASAAIAGANALLADFQKIRRWMLWPEPDLPRTSSGKVKRKAVVEWLAKAEAAKTAGNAAGTNGPGANDAHTSSDWLLALIGQISGEAPHGAGDELRLDEDLHLDSLGRVQLADEIEDRLGVVSGNGLLEQVQTLGELRRLLAGDGHEPAHPDAQPVARLSEQQHPGEASSLVAVAAPAPNAPVADATAGSSAPLSAAQVADHPALWAAEPRRTQFVYPEWPWWKPVQWLRAAFVEMVMRPLVWLLAGPRVTGPAKQLPAGPMLIVANHVTAYDGALIEYALTGPVRRHMAIAMLGEMLEDYRHWRNPDRKPGTNGFFLFGPPAYWLVTALFNVFPLPRQRDFQSSFHHAGNAMDHGYNVMVFPEGARSPEGTMGRFRAGIGLLVKQSRVPVVPMAMVGLGELKAERKRWFRSGKIELRIGEPLTFGPLVSEAEITARLQYEVEKLLKGSAVERTEKAQ